MVHQYVRVLHTEEKREQLIVQYKQALNGILGYSSSDEFAEKVCCKSTIDNYL